MGFAMVFRYSCVFVTLIRFNEFDQIMVIMTIITIMTMITIMATMMIVISPNNQLLAPISPNGPFNSLSRLSKFLKRDDAVDVTARREARADGLC